VSSGPIGIILLNLGGPERLEDVEPFLYNLFSDRQIIRLGPAFLQKPLARWIAWRRAPKSRRSYSLIGGGSPLSRITREQSAALAAQLKAAGDFRVALAMRYWHPFTEEALAGLTAAGVSRLIGLTLYPHYSIATTGSSLSRLHEVVAEQRHAFEIAEVREWPTAAGYIAALAATITEGLDRMAGDSPAVVYSAHSLPAKLIEEGDPYLDQIKATIAAVETITRRPGHLCFQSRSGPVRWLAPSTPEMLQQLAEEGARSILMVPISFVSDHVETLYEIDILYREQAAGLNMRLERTESLNTRPQFIDALADLVLEAVQRKGWGEGSCQGAG